MKTKKPKVYVVEYWSASRGAWWRSALRGNRYRSMRTATIAKRGAEKDMPSLKYRVRPV